MRVEMGKKIVPSISCYKEKKIVKVNVIINLFYCKDYVILYSL
ncbi:hypothetical protein EZS27_011174 [termite gut metagenome]|uniref:Uncharacterized protein n=1 Tax=termite gut metagenome TaxID=433724 RepID=A0A5J4S582_9ZZZZ